MKHRKITKPLPIFGLFLLLLFPPLNLQSQTIFNVPAEPYETCIVDYDQDGDNDIIVGCHWSDQLPDSLVIFYNDGWGNFEEQRFETGNQTYIYCEDLTNDGYPDLITRYSGNPDGVYFYENDKEGGLGSAYFITDMVGNTFVGGIADIDLDGYLDIVNYDITIPWGWGVAFNNGDNTFTDSAFVESNDQWFKTTTGDLNDDDRADILVATVDQSETVHILYNHHPVFEKMNIATPDWNPGYILNVDNDGLNDVLLEKQSYFGSTRLVNMINKRNHFQACDTLVFVNGTGIINIGDYNLDGYDDLTMSVYQANNQPIEDSIYIYFNDQHCGYTHVQSVYMGDFGWLPTINQGDLNGDGYPELVVQGYHFPRNNIRILWNDGTGNFIDTNSVYVYQREIDQTIHINFYPNPTSGNISIQSSFTKIKTVSLFDLSGRTLFEQNRMGETRTIDLNLSNLQLKPGIYLCAVQLENEMLVFRKIIFTKTQ